MKPCDKGRPAIWISKDKEAMKFEDFSRSSRFARLLRAIFLALCLLITSLAGAPRLRADQDHQEVIDMLTKGQWMFHGVIRTFNPDGTYSSKSAKGTWSIKGNELDISLGRSMMRFNLPLDPSGTPGVSAGGITQTLSRVGSGEGGRPLVAPASPSGELGRSAAHLIQAYHGSFVFVNGAEGAGSGFVAAMGKGNFLVTNVHVAAGIPGAEFKSLDGATIQSGSPSMASGEDIFCMALPAGGTPLPVMSEVESNATVGDDVVVLGNAEGEGVLNTITGKIVGIGPNLVEVDAPFVPGNSGSPIIHLKTGKVIGVATYLIVKEYDLTTKRKMVRREIRRFGYRLDNVKQWQAVNWGAFRQQAAEIESITGLTDDLYDLLNDLVESRGDITRGRHTNPALKDGLQKWFQSQKSQQDWRGTFRSTGNEELVLFLKTVCAADIGMARRQISYDYFQRQLAEQKQYRDLMVKAFEEILLGTEH